MRNSRPSSQQGFKPVTPTHGSRPASKASSKAEQTTSENLNGETEAPEAERSASQGRSL